MHIATSFEPPKNGKRRRRKIFLHRCEGCDRDFASKKINAKICNLSCRKNVSAKKLKAELLTGHYISLAPDSIVFLYTKSKKLFFVSNYDLDSVLRYSWTNDSDGYIVTRVRCNEGYVELKLHRFILGLTDPESIVDHIDNNPANNCRENLRITSRKVNYLNSEAAFLKYGKRRAKKMANDAHEAFLNTQK